MVADITLRSDMWRAVRDSLNSANLGSSSVTVYGSYPDDEPSFPMVIVNNCTVAKDGQTYDRTYNNKTIVIVVDLYTKRSDQIDLIGDELDNVIQNLNISGASLRGSNESLAVSPANDNKIHLKSFSYEYFRG